MMPDISPFCLDLYWPGFISGAGAMLAGYGALLTVLTLVRRWKGAPQ